MKLQFKTLAAALCVFVGLQGTAAAALTRSYSCESASAVFAAKAGRLEVAEENIIINNAFWGRYTLALSGKTKPLPQDRYVSVGIDKSPDKYFIPTQYGSTKGRRLRAALTLVVRGLLDDRTVYVSNSQVTTGVGGKVSAMVPLGSSSFRNDLYRFSLYYEFPAQNDRPSCSYVDLIAP